MHNSTARACQHSTGAIELVRISGSIYTKDLGSLMKSARNIVAYCSNSSGEFYSWDFGVGEMDGEHMQKEDRLSHE